MFIEKAQVKIQAGDGGNGLVSFRHEKFIDRGGPDLHLLVFYVRSQLISDLLRRIASQSINNRLQDGNLTLFFQTLQQRGHGRWAGRW